MYEGSRTPSNGREYREYNKEVADKDWNHSRSVFLALQEDAKEMEISNRFATHSGMQSSPAVRTLSAATPALVKRTESSSTTSNRSQTLDLETSQRSFVLKNLLEERTKRIVQLKYAKNSISSTAPFSSPETSMRPATSLSRQNDVSRHKFITRSSNHDGFLVNDGFEGEREMLGFESRISSSSIWQEQFQSILHESAGSKYLASLSKAKQNTKVKGKSVRQGSFKSHHDEAIDLIDWLTEISTRNVCSVSHIKRIPPFEKQVDSSITESFLKSLKERDLQRLRNSDFISGKSRVIIFDRKASNSQNPEGDVYFEKHLRFSSSFESGNLRRVTQVGVYEYDIQLEPDTNSNRHMQWFYFQVSNVQKGVSYKFNIVNMCKSKSLYNYGLRPLRYSECHAKSVQLGWERSCKEIAYYKSGLYYRSHSRIPFRTLTFTYVGEYDDDTVYFAHCYPYTVNQLSEDLTALMESKDASCMTNKVKLGRSPGGNDCYTLEISATAPDEILQSRKVIFILARCHPGETPSSYMMKGVIEFLVGTSPAAKKLREKFVFVIIPMLNPDGVTAGNTRTTLLGDDLNRHWHEPDQKHRPLDLFKEYLSKHRSHKEVFLAVDLHAHSRRKNIFSYGCTPSKEYIARDRLPTGYERVFPYILSKMCDAFKYEQCTFDLKKGREGTGRSVLFKDFQIRAAYTIEASFLGGNFGKYDGLHYTTADYEKFGKQFCEAVLEFSNEERMQWYLREIRAQQIADDSDESEESDYSSEGLSDDEAFPASPREVYSEVHPVEIIEKQVSPSSRAEGARPFKYITKSSEVKRDSFVVVPHVKVQVSSSHSRGSSPSNSPIEKLPSPERVALVKPPGSPTGARTKAAVKAESPVLPAASAPTMAGKNEKRKLVAKAHGLNYYDSSVLDRVRDMRKQMTGTNDEFVLLQGRISRIAGYSQRLFGANAKSDA
mmetsp:Transcript_50943/g.159167  ORF Transcript_50943/g.159167 Transcript_50943/m.159167 type:complete len:946 (-) Transcript_50943:252-3089(-)